MIAKSLPKDMLEQADFLASKETKRPKQASLRRAVSAAYYALFHLLSVDGSEMLAPNVRVTTRHKIQRWFDHGAIKEICGKFVASPLGKPLSDLIAPGASSDLQRVARSFIELQNARHSADYDMSWTLTREQAQIFIQQARDASEAWIKIRKTEEANVFILSLFLWKHLEKTR